ncbi:SDR family oxidoreductase [Limisphaera sp. VF-2]|jgi:UDP-N-acetylglucosamine 4-epimerase|uniref:SDR family oxidoreductase n=1 Tax=Limisphaera sp. VF-2 TaxID=3400418 RepID=UPI0017680AF0|nr:SDR family oxidoreductase [Limisphaera sp.]
MNEFSKVAETLRNRPRTWLVTGAAGFIGSHLLETLLSLDQSVIALDNFSTGKPENLEAVRTRLQPAQWARCRIIEGDVADAATCAAACQGVDYVLHHAALGSVPRSLAEPRASHRANVTGFLELLEAARHAGVKRVVYASSSSVYGDAPELPKREDRIGRPLSPYAATKWMNEIYADTWGRVYGLECIGLRYFNVFGPRQDPQGPYAAVIPRWMDALWHGRPVTVYGDGETSRDFCYVANVVQANLLAATTDRAEAVHQVYNIAVGERTSLNELYHLLVVGLRRWRPDLNPPSPVYEPFRPGDVRHSQADISKARRLLGYDPPYRLAEGLELTWQWFHDRGD